MATRQEIEAEFTTDPQTGLIGDLGKFEREPLYVPYFWFQTLEGGGDEDYGALQGINLTAEDFATWPELTAAKWSVGDTLWLYESDSGFVSIIPAQDAQAIIDAQSEDSE